MGVGEPPIVTLPPAPASHVTSLVPQHVASKQACSAVRTARRSMLGVPACDDAALTQSFTLQLTAERRVTRGTHQLGCKQRSARLAEHARPARAQVAIAQRRSLSICSGLRSAARAGSREQRTSLVQARNPTARCSTSACARASHSRSTAQPAGCDGAQRAPCRGRQTARSLARLRARTLQVCAQRLRQKFNKTWLGGKEKN